VTVSRHSHLDLFFRGQGMPSMRGGDELWSGRARR
jgi:hypothetical protein